MLGQVATEYLISNLVMESCLKICSNMLKGMQFRGEETYSCVERNRENLARFDQLQADLERVVDNALVAAPEEDLPVIDLWEYLSEYGLCEIVVGGVRIYKDSNHFRALMPLCLPLTSRRGCSNWSPTG